MEKKQNPATKIDADFRFKCPNFPLKPICTVSTLLHGNISKSAREKAHKPPKTGSSGTEHILSQIHWQYLVTIGLHDKKGMSPPRAKDIWAGFRGRLARMTRTSPKRLMWAVVLELGKSAQNPHLHALISGLPRATPSESIIQTMVAIGQKMMTPDVVAKAYAPGLSAVAYIHKELEPQNGVLRSDHDCWPMISDSVWRALQRHPNKR